MNIIPRDIPPRSVWALEQAGVHPLLAQLYAARGVTQPEELDNALSKLLTNLMPLKGITLPGGMAILTKRPPRM